MNAKEFKIKFQKFPIREYANNLNIRPLVSVCVQTYQHSKYIEQCLDGILMQKTSFAFEVLIGEDESIDGTRDICIEYADRYPDKIRLFLHRRENNIRINGSPTGRFNFLYNLFSTKGKYIAFCEGDDYWTDTHKLQKQVDFLETNPDFAICFHNIQIIYEDEPRLNRLSNINQQEITSIENLARGNYIYTASCVFRKYLSEIPDWFYQCPVGDYPLHLLNAQYGKIKFIDQVMGVYRVHKGGIWEKESWVYKNSKWAYMLDIISNKFNENVNKILNNQLYDSYLQVAEYYFQNGDIEKCKVYLMKIIEKNPYYLLEVIKEEKFARIKKIEGTYSWRITAPLRWLANKIMPNK